MSGMIGELPRFYSSTDDWQVYTERLEQFFEINEIPEEKKKALLITSISEDIYKTLRDVCHPVLPKSKTYDELCALLEKQFVVKTSIYRERHHFYNVKQYPNESISNWFARIKKLSVDCKFGSKFEDILLDRFISGLRPSPILDRICEESELTLEQAVDIAMNRESSLKGTANEAGTGDIDCVINDITTELDETLLQQPPNRKQNYRGRRRGRGGNNNRAKPTEE